MPITTQPTVARPPLVDQNRTDYAAESQWGQRFGYQVFVLLKKNLRLLTRNRTSTACRLGACVLFMLLAKVLVLSLSAALENEKFVRAEPHPVETPILGIQSAGSVLTASPLAILLLRLTVSCRRRRSSLNRISKALPHVISRPCSALTE